MNDFSFCPNQASLLLALMANPQRLRILEIIEHQECSVGRLAEAVGLSQSAISQHLKKLRDGEVVHTRRDAQTVFYSLNSERVSKIIAMLKVR